MNGRHMRKALGRMHLLSKKDKMGCRVANSPTKECTQKNIVTVVGGRLFHAH